MVQTVLGGAQGAADVGNVVDGVLNGLQRIGSIGLVSDVQVSNTKRPGVTVIDSDIQLVVAGRGIADLQSQCLTCHSGIALASQSKARILNGLLKCSIALNGSTIKRESLPTNR